MPMGMADAATVLFTRFLKFDAADPSWPDRDRFVLSAGHGSMLLYAIGHLVGYAGLPMEELRRFRQLGARTAGHPEFGHAPGVETTTGPLGQGLATAVGMAIAERMMAARYGDDLVDHRTFVIAGDGCLMEGISQEAIDLAGHLGLGKLVVLWDDNGITIDGSTALSTRTDQAGRFAASGWHVVAVDGHDMEAVAQGLEAATADPRPSLVACRTVIGRGAPGKQGSEAAHGAPLGAQEVAAVRAALGWTLPPFEVPEAVAAAWQEAGRRHAGTRRDWEARLAASPDAAAFRDAVAGTVPPALPEAMAAFRRGLVADRPTVATRKASEMALGVINAAMPTTVGGSADLTHSNLTVTRGLATVTADDASGRYLRYGIREHAMAAAMNGIALHGGFVPYGGTFLVFSDYARGAIRLSALMGLRVVYVLTHDSIGLGEDGPTHQAVEHTASLRLIPNMRVWRPCDAVETAVAWQDSIERANGPSSLVLTRQALPAQPRQAGQIAAIRRGGYVLRDADRVDLILIATGSEVALAVAAADALTSKGHGVRVVSMPCPTLFAAQDAAWQESVLPAAVKRRIAIEAGVTETWHRWVGPAGRIVGLDTFGKSAPAKDLFQHFGFTPERIAKEALELLGA
jgi:transketolase